MANNLIRTTGSPHSGICEICEGEKEVHTIIGERDSFGTEYLEWCSPCLEKVRAEAQVEEEAKVAKLIEELGGEQDVACYVSMLGNRDTVDECEIVQGTRQAALRYRTLNLAVEARGDYPYAYACRIATPADHANAKRFRQQRYDYDAA